MDDQQPGDEPEPTPRDEPEWQRRRRLAEVFGDVLPETTSDENGRGVVRRPGRGPGPLAAQPGATPPRLSRGAAVRDARIRCRGVLGGVIVAVPPFCCAARRSRISWSSLTSSGVPGSGLGKKRSLALV